MKQVQQKKQTNNEILPTYIINRFIKDHQTLIVYFSFLGCRGCKN